jgi:Alpha mannosidase middle domain
LQRLKKIDISAMFGPRFDSLNIFYSSPDYYTKCKYDEFKAGKAPAAPGSDVRYSVKSDDFMPYSDCEHCFWTGYFTSRAGLKRLERVSSSFLLSARQIETMWEDTRDPSHDPYECQHAMEELEDASAVAQHHDAVSGTSKQHVAYDYAKRIQNGMDLVSTCATRKIQRLLRMASNTTIDLADLMYCQLLNETKCSVSQVRTIDD